MFESLKDLDPKVLVALVGVFSAIVSAIVGALVSRWQAASKFREQLEKYRLERRDAESDQYLQQAREHTETVYVPLSSALALLKASFQRYVFEGRTDTDRQLFLTQIDNFIAELQRLERQGATAFITTELEELILAFTTFIRASKHADEPRMEVVYDFSISVGGMSSSTSTSNVVKVSPKNVLARIGDTVINIPGIRMGVRTSDLIQAPIQSDEFQARFERDTHRINVLVKEVTLGSAAKSWA